METSKWEGKPFVLTFNSKSLSLEQKSYKISPFLSTVFFPISEFREIEKENLPRKKEFPTEFLQSLTNIIEGNSKSLDSIAEEFKKTHDNRVSKNQIILKIKDIAIKENVTIF